MFRCGIDPGYVMDRMMFYEIETLIGNQWMRDKESWEQARLQAYMTAQVNSTRRIDMDDFLTFPWEKGVKVEDTPEERESLMREMKEWEIKMNKNDNQS